MALTPVDYQIDPRLAAEPPSHKPLREVADIVIDLGGGYGDTELDFTPGDRSFSAIPGSGITGMLAIWRNSAEAAGLLSQREPRPLIWDSRQMPGAHTVNLERYAGYRLSRNGMAR